VPTLDLRIAENKSLTDSVTGASLVTFTRASSGTYVDSAGVIQTALTDAPRFDHNPTTGESLGLLVEEARTNSLPNSTAQGAVAGSPGTAPTGWIVTGDANGISREIVGTGTEDGITYIDIKYSGTSTGAGSFNLIPSAVNTIVAASGQSWTGSAFVKLQAGTLVNVINPLMGINGRSTAGASIEAAFNSFNPTTDSLKTQRRTVTIALANASSERVTTTVFGGSYVSGDAIDFTLRIGLPQLELGAFATSVIPTTTAAVTRSADVASITGTAFSSWYRQDEGTVFADVASIYNGGRYFMFDNGTVSERWEIRYSSYVAVGSSWSNNIQDVAANTNVTSILLASNIRTAFANASNNAAIASNGIGAQLGTDSSSTMPASQSRFLIGSFQGTGTYANGSIRRLTYWPARLPNSTLQSITQ